MNRTTIITTLGKDYLTSNHENDEFSYPKAFKKAGITFVPIKSSFEDRTYEFIDRRLVKDGVTILIETKDDINVGTDRAEEQLAAYISYEKKLTNNKIVSILASTNKDDIKVWRGAILPSNFLPKEKVLKNIDAYISLYSTNVNNKEQVMKSTFELNELLHSYGISESLRAQFVGTCLLSLKNGLVYQTPGISANQIRTSMHDTLENLLNSDLNKAAKLALLDRDVLKSQDVRALNIDSLNTILKKIDSDIMPYINDKSTAGQDLLNLFFITFNKYVGKADKNQAFTPDHITDFMSKVCKVNKDSIILDPCCGSGSFLVRAMTQELEDCLSEAEQENVKKKHIFGIEYEDKAFGLSTTNMLIHGDGNSNVIQGSCFDFKDWIKETRPNVVLMNPPYNATKKYLPESFTKTWKAKQKEDPSKGFYFVKFVIDTLNEINIRGKFAVLLPVSVAIGNSKIIKEYKEKILEKNTLDAVFTLPNEVFYPGASVSACCMIFDIGVKHADSGATFFGYYKEDGFKKKKKLGRIEQVDSQTGKSKWEEIENLWLDLYKNRTVRDGLSSVKKVNHKDEWLCEAYMKTDYTFLNDNDFQTTINNYLAHLVKKGDVYES